MAKFHFFTDIDLLTTQAQTDAYGPVQGSEETDFRVTSLHASTAVCNAYAVCDGSILIQEIITDPTYVNIILKPKNQGDVSFLNVKYFIYRRILKSSLVDSSDPDKVAPTIPFHVTKSIWDGQKALNDSYDKANNNAPNTTQDEPSSKCLGISFSLNATDSKPDTDPIDSIFYKQSFDFKAPPVTAGMIIGTYDYSHYGFEIMVHSLGFNPTLELVRNDENRITATVLPGGSFQLPTIQNYSQREKILNYIDPCAFYGLHLNSKIIVHDSSGASDAKSGTQLYNKVLTTFFNYDVVYLDIRNENGYSYNYYNNYGNKINISFDPTGKVSGADYTTFYWPIKILKNSDFATGNNSKKNIIKLSPQQGDNTNPLIYLAHGHWYDRYPRYPKNKNKFIPLDFSSGTPEVQIASPNIDGLSVTTSSCWYIKLYYIKRNDPAASPGNTLVVPTKHHFDNLFSPVALPTFWDNSDGIKFASGLHEKFLDAEATLGFAGMVETGIAMEQNRVVHFAYPTDVFISQVKRQDVFKRIQGGSSNKESFFDAIKNIFPKLKLTKKKLQLSPDKYYLRYNEEGPENVKENFWGICLTTSEHQDLVNAISSTQLEALFHHPFIITKTNVVSTDAINNAFYQIEHAVAGITTSGVKEESSAILNSYSDDGVLKSSNDAATTENITETTEIEDIVFDASDPDKWGKVVARLSVYNQIKLWVFVDEQGSNILYDAGETDYFNNTISGLIQLPAGTRVIQFESKNIKINGELKKYIRIVCFYRNKFREGYVDEKSLFNSQNYYINFEDGQVNDELLIEAFINDAKMEIKLAQFLSDGSLIFEQLLTSTENKLNQFINNCNTTNQFSLDLINGGLKGLSKNSGLESNNYNKPSTIQNYATIQPLNDILNPTNFIVCGFAADWLGIRNGSSGFNSDIFLFSLNNCPNLGDATHGFSGESHTYTISGSGEPIKKELKKLSDFISNLSATDPLKNTSEAQWILSTQVQTFINLTSPNNQVFVSIHDSVWKSPKLYSIWAQRIPVDQSFGFIASDRVFSTLIHEYNVSEGPYIINLCGGDSHARDSIVNGKQNPQYFWEQIKINGFNSVYNSLHPDPANINYDSEDAFRLKDFLQRSPGIGIVYLKYYLDQFIP